MRGRAASRQARSQWEGERRAAGVDVHVLWRRHADRWALGPEGAGAPAIDNGESIATPSCPSRGAALRLLLSPRLRIALALRAFVLVAAAAMDFLKSAVASAISKGPAFGYSFGDRVDIDQSIWTLHNGTKRVWPGRPLRTAAAC